MPNNMVRNKYKSTTVVTNIACDKAVSVISRQLSISYIDTNGQNIQSFPSNLPKFIEKM